MDEKDDPDLLRALGAKPGLPKQRVRRKAGPKEEAAMSLAKRIAAARKEREDEQLDAIGRWLEEKWGKDGAVCPYCGSQDWAIGTPSRFLLGDGEETIPFFIAGCTNCGQTTLIDARQAGVPYTEDDD